MALTRLILMINWAKGMKLRAVYLFAGVCLLFTGCGKSPSRELSPEARQQARLSWNLKTLVTDYENFGSTDPSWDGPATNALIEFARTRSGTVDPDEPWAEIISTNCTAAVKAGCDDPMVRYLYIKFSMNETNTPKTFSDAFIDVETNMQASGYHPIRKFYASLRAYQQFTYAYGYGRNVDWTVPAKLMADALSNLVGVLNDQTTPPAEVYDACDEFIYVIPGDINIFQSDYDQIEKPLFANWPDEATSWLLKGEAYHAMAWIYRGNGYADTITAQGQKGFAKDLAIEEKALDRAWELDPADARIAVAMINLGLGQGQDRDWMEKWFERAMEDNPNDYDACSAKLNYLEPKWYGSTADMLAFGRECVQNTNWGGTVPLTLVDAHYSICTEYTDKDDQANYWKRPDVWADVSASYERYLQNYPNDDARIAYYAMYAYDAEKWDKLNQLLPKVQPPYYSVFGGADEFARISQLARERASQP